MSFACVLCYCIVSSGNELVFCFLMKIITSLIFVVFFEFFWFFRQQGPRNLLQRLIINNCLVARCTGIDINFLTEDF